MGLPDDPDTSTNPTPTPVRFRLDTASPSGLVTRSGSWRMTWVGRIAESDRIVTGASYDVTPLPEEVAAGSFLQPLIPNDTVNFVGRSAWKVTEPGGTTRYVVVPEQAGEVNYSTLTEVDPATLDPAAPTPPGVAALIADLVKRVMELQEAVAAGSTTVQDPITDASAYVADYLGEYA